VERPAAEPCAWPACGEVGEFRAPLSNRAGGDVAGWQYLCLEHVRAFNARYNYFDGMTPDEVSAAQSPLAGWVRETVKGKPVFSLGDPHEIFGGSGQAAGPANPRKWQDDRWAGTGDAQALGALGLDRSATPADIKRAYRRLVRRYHPDSNGGDRAQEGKLQAVVKAFTHLRGAAGYKMESDKS
jgi:hypothetical protein